MREQLYLDDRIRKMLKEPFETFDKTYAERVIAIFSSLEEESQTIADEKYHDLGRYLILKMMIRQIMRRWFGKHDLYTMRVCHSAV